MGLFFVQYKKVIMICTIPIIVVVAFIGFEIKHGQDNHSESLTVNKEMQAMLQREVKQTATPSPTETYSSNEDKAALEFEQPAASAMAVEQSAKPKTTSKPKSTSKSKTAAKSQKTLSANFKVNLNKAMMEELVKLPGIGESKAKAIIAYRDAHSFQKLEELMEVKGIGPKIFEKIRDHLEL